MSKNTELDIAGKTIDLSSFPQYDNHEKVLYIEDKESGLEAVIAIHTAQKNGCIGGTRLYNYPSIEFQIADALNLSAAMTKKCNISSLDFGGAKGVINSSKLINRKLGLKRYAEFVTLIQEQFYTGEDVGLTTQDVDFMASVSDRIIGGKNGSGSPSPWAARSVFLSALSALQYLHGDNTTFSGKSVAIKGVGGVGSELARILINAGAKVIVADIDKDALNELKYVTTGYTVVESNTIHKLDVDVYSPCAMSKEITDETISEIGARIVCGAANNQVNLNRRTLDDAQFLYIPDFIANAGGLINVSSELVDPDYSTKRIESKLQNLRINLENILKKSEGKNLSILEICETKDYV